MFSYNTTVKLHQTDAAGLLFFGNLFTLVHDAYEGFLANSSIDIAHIVRNESYLLPIVHTEADYKKPFDLGDKVLITVQCEHIGKHSFTLVYSIKNGNNEIIAAAKTVHAVVDKESREKTGIPSNLLPVLKSAL